MERKIDVAKVEREAKSVLDKFAKALEKVEKEHDIDFYVEREDNVRIEKDGENSADGFKERILKNAPKKDNDFIIAEKGSWK